MTQTNVTTSSSTKVLEDAETAPEPDSLPTDHLWEYPKGNQLELIIADPRWQAHIDDALKQDVAQLVLFVHELIEEPSFAACLRWTDDSEMQQLNSQFRDKDKATNVLSFPDDEISDNGMMRIGDLAFGFETMAEEASQMGITIGAHMRHLIIHGLLHLIGFDHEDEEDGEEMEALEIAALSVIGVENPYLGELA